MEDLSVLDLPENVFCSTAIYTYLAFVPQVFPVVCKYNAIMQIQAKKRGTIKGIGFFGCRNFIQLSFFELIDLTLIDLVLKSLTINLLTILIIAFYKFKVKK